MLHLIIKQVRLGKAHLHASLVIIMNLIKDLQWNINCGIQTRNQVTAGVSGMYYHLYQP